MPTKSKILQLLKQNGQVTGNELSGYLGLSDRAVRKQLKNLLEDGKVLKMGTPPKVYYYLNEEKMQKDIPYLDKNTEEFINNNYLYISPIGERLDGVSGFVEWCKKTNQPVEKTAKNYVESINKYYKFKRHGLINGTLKLKNTFQKTGLEKLYYLDFYSIDRFGKTKLGQLLLYAKQSQNKLLMKEISTSIRPKILRLIKRLNVTGIGFIPPTVKRQFQFMKELQKNLRLDLNEISIVKAKISYMTPQKTLNKLEDRIENAKKTIIVDDKNIHKNILLIDDAVGSGATLNETSLQIKKKKLCTGKIYGLAIVGSFKGFDVISEV